MSISKEEKKNIISKYGKNESDTGSTAVQVAILTTRIEALTEHLRTHKKDLHCRRGLVLMVGQRRSLLDYLKRKDTQQYLDLIKSMGLRR